jgi:hypothetical protein
VEGVDAAIPSKGRMPSKELTLPDITAHSHTHQHFSLNTMSTDKITFLLNWYV